MLMTLQNTRCISVWERALSRSLNSQVTWSGMADTLDVMAVMASRVGL
jgi:hypothetical protein